MIMTMAMRSVGQLVGRDSDELDEFFLFLFLSWRGVWFGAYLTYIRYLTLCKGRQLEIEEERYTTIPYNFILARLFQTWHRRDLSHFV